VFIWTFIINDITSNKVGIHWNIFITIAAWIVYTLDHLFDGYKKNTFEIVNRHYFVYENRKIIIPSIATICIVLFVLGIKLFSLEIYLMGILMIVVCLAYLLLVNKLKLAIKELFASIIFTFGIWFVPIYSLESISIFNIIHLSLFFLFVLFNIIYLAVSEFEYDKKNGFSGLVQFVGKNIATTILYLITIIQIGLYIYLLSNVKTDVFMALVLLMIVAEVFILAFKHKIEKYNLYRQAADGVFLLAILYPFIKFLELI
jgi:hypothetical protein